MGVSSSVLAANGQPYEVEGRLETACSSWAATRAAVVDASSSSPEPHPSPDNRGLGGRIMRSGFIPCNGAQWGVPLRPRARPA